MGLRGVRKRITIHRPERRWRITLAMLASVCLHAQPAYAKPTSAADRAATHAFLQATYTFDLELLRNKAKTNAALDRTAAALAAECPKVLAGAPGGPSGFTSTIGAKQPGAKQPSSRARGEADRHQRQYQDLSDELEAALHSAAFQLDGQALATFTATVTPLHWSNAAIAPAVQFELSFTQAVFGSGPAPPVCADMRSWVDDGYQTLSAGTKAYEIQQNGLLGSSPVLKTSSETLLEPYEGPGERAILRRREALPTSDIFELGGSTTTELHRQLGIEEDPSSNISGGATVSKSKTFGHGRTHTGVSFKVEVLDGYGPSCEHVITFSVTLPSEGGTVTSSSGTSLRCLSGKRPAPRADVKCEGGVLQVESSTLAQTRRVRLTLSNRHTIDSSVTLVPRKYGGPAGVYFQMVRGPSPYPVSLSELDAAGQVMRTVALRAVKDCRLTTPKHVFRRLATQSSPNGQGFTITGFANSEDGHHSFNLYAEGPGFSPSGAGESPLESPAPSHTKYFPWHLSVGCEPHPFALIYGRLIPDGATVLVATATTPLAPLTQVKIPTALKAPGMLAYSLLLTLPTELVVMSATGATLAKEDLTENAKNETEYCEGYVEPAG